MLFNIKTKTTKTLKVVFLILFSVMFGLYITHIFLPDLKINEILLLNNINVQSVMNFVTIRQSTKNNDVLPDKDELIYPPLEINKNDLNILDEDLDNLKKATYLIDIIKDSFLNTLYKNIRKIISFFNINILDLEPRVYKFNINSKYYILKRISKNNDFNSNDLIAEQFDSPNIVRILASFSRNLGKNNSYIWFISEYLNVPVDGEYITNGNIKKIQKIAIDLLNGLDALHKQNVIHGDLFERNICGKPEKDGSVTFKLIDFGLAKKYDDEEKFSKEARKDFYCFGVLIYDIANNMKDFEHISRLEKTEFLDFCLFASGHYSENIPKSVQDLFDHPFISGLQRKI